MSPDWESIGASLKPYRIWIVIVGLIAILGFVLWMMDCGGQWWTQRQIGKGKAEIANSINQAANIKKEISNLETQYAVEIEKAKQAANQYDADRHATDQQRANTNQQLENMNRAINANRGNVTAQDIDKLLDQLK